MAENPATWGEAEHVVADALHDHDANMRSPDPVIGVSVVRRITDALRDAGLLADSRETTQGGT